ncbi:MAG: hypothetical protein QMC62_03690 [Alteromonadaceae bacterium]
MTLSTRETIILSVDEYLKIDVMDFSQLRFIHPLKPDTGRPIDIGSIAYSIRQRSKDINQIHVELPTLVNTSTFRKERLFFLSNLSCELIKKRPASIHNLFQVVLRVIDWFDNNNFQDCFLSPEKLHEAYFAYTNYLVERVLIEGHLDSINPRCAKDYQWGCRKIIALIFPEKVESITAGVRALRGKSEPSLPISKNYIERYWKINHEIFIKFSAQCFSDKAFPPLIKVEDINSYYYPFHSKNIRLDSIHTIRRQLTCPVGVN